MSVWILFPYRHCFSVDNKSGGADSTAMALVSGGKCGMKVGQSRVKSRRLPASARRREQPVAAIPKLNDSDSFWKFRTHILAN